MIGTFWPSKVLCLLLCLISVIFSVRCLLCLAHHGTWKTQNACLFIFTSKSKNESIPHSGRCSTCYCSWFASVFKQMSLSGWVVKGWWHTITRALKLGRHEIHFVWCIIQNWCKWQMTLNDTSDTWYQWYLCNVETGHTQPLETCLTSVNNRAKIQAVGQNLGDVGDLRWSCPPGRSNTTGSSAVFVAVFVVPLLWRAQKSPEIPSVQWVSGNKCSSKATWHEWVCPNLVKPHREATTTIRSPFL